MVKPVLTWLQRPQREVHQRPRSWLQSVPHLALLAHLVLGVLVLAGINPASGLAQTDLAFGREIDLKVFAPGLFLLIAGNLLRIDAIRRMGDSLEREILVRAEHRLITSGSFQFSRHPIYLGHLLAECGLGLALGYWPLVVWPISVSLPLWILRARAEERLLAATFGVEWSRYRDDVPFLFPRIRA